MNKHKQPPPSKPSAKKPRAKLARLRKSLVFYAMVGPLLLGGFVLSQTTAVETDATLTDWLTPLIVIALLILLNGLYVSAEFAIIGTRPSQMEELRNNGNRTAGHVLSILENSQRQDQYIATAQLGITIASLGLGMYAEPAVAHLIEPYLAAWFNITDSTTLHTISYLLVLSVLTYLHVVMGEMVPKSIALGNASQIVLFISYPMRLSQKLLTPLVRLLNGMGGILLRILDLPLPQTRLHSVEEIQQIVHESAAGGFINEEEREIITNILDFGDRTVGQVMTPRRKVQAIALDMPHDELLKFVITSRHNRFPVYEENRDHVAGILHLRDLVKQMMQNKQVDLRLLVHPAPVVPEDERVEELLATFKQQRIHMAIVLDEFGGLAGIVTLEDLVEEVVGEVRDEFDVEREPLVELAPGVLEVAGNFLVDDLQELVYLGEEADLPDVETVGGLIVTELAAPPKLGDMCTYRENIHFTVTAVDGLAVARARIEFPTYDNETETMPDAGAG